LGGLARGILRGQRAFEEEIGSKVDNLDKRMTAIEGAISNLNSAFSTRALRSPNKHKRLATEMEAPIQMEAPIPANRTEVTPVAPRTGIVIRPPSPMLKPGDPIEPKGMGAIQYVKASLQRRPHKPCETSRGGDLLKAFKAVLLSTEKDTFTCNALQDEPVAVHHLLEKLEDRIIARFREIFATNEQEIPKRSWLQWGDVAYTSIDNKLSDLKKSGWPKPQSCNSIRNWFFNPLPDAAIAALPSRPPQYQRGIKKVSSAKPMANNN
jgi:hypothetical protein